MQEVILTAIITIQAPVLPTPVGAKRPKPVFVEEQPPMCWWKVHYENQSA